MQDAPPGPCPTLGLWEPGLAAPSLPAQSASRNICLKGHCQDQKCFVNQRGLSWTKGQCV